MKESMKKKKWVQAVASNTTSPPKGIFTKDAETIARVLAKPSVSPKGLGSAVRMLQFFINRGGKGLSSRRKKELESAKRLLQKRMKEKE